jgi:hypothetical protein
MHSPLLFAATMVARPTRPTVDPFSFLNFTWLIGPIITIVILAVVFGTVILPLIRRSAERTRLLRTGEQAQARIVGLGDTGVKINGNPQVAIQLEVHPSGTGANYREGPRQPYQAQCVMTVSYLAIPRIQPGMMVPVRFDPADPSKVTIEM